MAKGAMMLQPSDERRRSGAHYTPSSLNFGGMADDAADDNPAARPTISTRPEFQIQLWLRHSDLETTLKYLAASDHKSEKTREQVNNTFAFVKAAA